jgi:hypothetical protein
MGASNVSVNSKNTNNSSEANNEDVENTARKSDNSVVKKLKE